MLNISYNLLRSYKITPQIDETHIKSGKLILAQNRRHIVQNFDANPTQTVPHVRCSLKWCKK